MVLSMPRPYRHPKTGIYWYRQRVPSALASAAGGKIVSVTVGGRVHTPKVGAEIKISLGTRDREEAKRLGNEAQSQFDMVWLSFSNAPVHLTLKQRVALSGEMYRVIKEALEEDPGAAGEWAERRRQRLALEQQGDASPFSSLKIKRPTRSLRERLGTWVDGTLRERHLRVDDETYQGLLEQFDRAAVDVAELLERRSKGDYSPDLTEQRFPSIELPSLEPSPPAVSPGTLTLTQLLDHKQKTQSKKERTFDKYRASIKDFVKVVGHEDARRIRKEDVRSWRDALIERGLATKTINDQYLSSVKALLSHGALEFDLPVNVALRMRDERDAPPPTGSKGYTISQATDILQATFSGSSKPLSVPYQRALFWVPWICAYTGLRVTEVTQFQGRHLRWQDGVPFMLITPEDGSTKSKHAWATGVHKHLIDLGLLEMFKAVGDGPAFYTPYPAGTDLQSIKDHRAGESAKRVAAWVTEELGIAAPGNRPSHAWRHTFTTLSRGRMDKEARDFMLGSRSQVDAREGYGDWPPAVLDAEINKLPRFKVTDNGWRPPVTVVAPLRVKDTTSRPIRKRRA